MTGKIRWQRDDIYVSFIRSNTVYGRTLDAGERSPKEYALVNDHHSWVSRRVRR